MLGVKKSPFLRTSGKSNPSQRRGASVKGYKDYEAVAVRRVASNVMLVRGTQRLGYLGRSAVANYRRSIPGRVVAASQVTPSALAKLQRFH